MNTDRPTTSDRRGWVGWLAGLALLSTLIFGLHGDCLGDGLFMDDHAHFRQLRESDWSLKGLTAACRLELIGGIAELWWLPPTTLRFFRPAAFGLMKLVYTLSDWSPAAQHLASLIWHLIVCLLLMLFLRRLGASVWLAGATAALFAIHPAHVATVRWIACQTELMVTAFLLGATLCFARYRGWPGFTTGATPMHPVARVGWGLAAVALFVLGLGCRENAVAFPFVLLAIEPLVWRRDRRWALGAYLVLAAVLVGYFIVRQTALGGLNVPPRPYVITPNDPGFLRYIFDKFLYYLLGEFLLIPCIPIGGLPYFQERPLLFYGLAAVALALLLSVTLRFLRRPPGLIVPAWLVGFTAPLLPVFASPHHLYLPGIGWALAALLILRGMGIAPQSAAPRWRRLRSSGMWVAVILLGTLFGLWTFYSGLAFETGQGVEDCLAEEVATAPSGLRPGDTLYLANLPLLGHYVRLPVEERTGLRGLRVIPLTWSPRLLGPATPTEMTIVDEHTIEIRVAEDRFFSGVLGRLVRDSCGKMVPDEVDRLGDLGIRVRVLERDERGISALRFEFARPLSDPSVHLFWGSRTRWAYEVRPRQ